MPFHKVNSKSKGFTLIELLVARHPKPWRRKAILGFTLIELLVVISIIGILVAVSTVSFTNAQQKSRDGRRKADLKGVQQALELYYQANGKYPADSGGGTGTDQGRIKCNTTVPSADDRPISWGSAFTCANVTYMQQLPKDPLDANNALNRAYYYNGIEAKFEKYILSAKLENNKDPDRAADCANSGRDYCLSQP